MGFAKWRMKMRVESNPKVSGCIDEWIVIRQTENGPKVDTFATRQEADDFSDLLEARDEFYKAKEKAKAAKKRVKKLLQKLWL